MATLLTLFIYSIAAFGFAVIVGFSKITFPARVAINSLGKTIRGFAWLLMLLECPLCLGFWEGVIAAWRLNLSLYGMGLIPSMILAGLYTAGSNFTLYGLVTREKDH